MDDLWVTMSEDVELIVRAISFQDFQLIMIHQRHRRYRQTDGQTTCDRKTVLCTILHRVVKMKWKGFFPVFCKNWNSRGGSTWVHCSVFITVTMNCTISVCFLRIGHRSRSVSASSPHGRLPASATRSLAGTDVAINLNRDARASLDQKNAAACWLI